MCDSKNIKTVGNPLKLLVSTDYPWNYNTMMHQQHVLDKIKIDNSSLARSFILPIKFINGRTLKVNMSFCTLEQVMSSSINIPTQKKIHNNVLENIHKNHKIGRKLANPNFTH